MKSLKFASFILLVVLIGCSKEEIKLPKGKTQENFDKHKPVEDYLDLSKIPRMVLDKYPKRNIIIKPSNVKGVILLDFDGHTVSGTSWNAGTNGSFTVSKAGLNDMEKQYILDSISKDFNQFGIYVTTDEVIYTRFTSTKRMRVIFTPDYQWYMPNPSVGGLSFTNSFTWPEDMPCFVFTSALGHNAKILAEAGSHEAGHTLGLHHQGYWNNGLLVQSYNPYPMPSGHNYIMGLPYYNTSDWGVGRNMYGNIQDDKAVINNTLSM